MHRQRLLFPALAATLAVCLMTGVGCGDDNKPSSPATETDAGGGTPDAGGGTPDSGSGIPDAGGGVPDGGHPPMGDRCGQEPSQATRSFCDPATWGGQAPTASSALKVSGEVVMDCDAEVRTLEIPASATLRASRERSSKLTLHGNLVVRGTLDYGSPGSRVCGPTAEIVFKGMDDTKFVGTPDQGPEGNVQGKPKMLPLTMVDSDYGVWVMGSGRVTAAGRLKHAWSKLTDGTGPADATFTVMEATGWEANDKIVLTPTARSSVPNHFLQFDEGTISSVDEATGRVTLKAAPKFDHEGCPSCVRRGEAINLSRNVVIRSFDTSAHAHMIVGEKGRLELDSVELRALGPYKACTGGEPQRRAPIYFHQQLDDSRGSYVRHTSIWGGKNQFLAIEASHGVHVFDIAGYDTTGDGFTMKFDSHACGTRCERDYAPADTVFRHVLAAKVAIPQRVAGCATIGSVSAILPGGGENTGCDDCSVSGNAYNGGTFGNEAALFFGEMGTGRPSSVVFKNSVAHNNAGHGVSNWQNSEKTQPPYDNIQAWSNTGNGIHHGAYTNGYEYINLTAQDNGEADFAVIAIQSDATRARLENALLDGFRTLPYFLVPTLPVVIKNAKFTGVRNPAITQVQDACSGGNENDPNDGTCIRNWLHFDNPQVPKGVKPFLFANHQNKFSSWEVRDFQHADYPTLPKNFDLYRKDNQVAGGAYNADFDAWLVPR
ncbi:hypothetical protein MYSTI_04706 [Myxococcus stipitatus DSM 14675]|uniref:CEMIP beta-helix domain-containing protein n=1 Tax=Myxococcus stipitatus (strain DSM 14675 / JCM 12634 / Mx s8) TaxID=1278073 RepID=L7UD89_MYXSD|nr:G8 domain-containing protein [Myxococcus stipitatus]AGC45998.1 hypothetical protein MYSTI_04706 [Myxococcus stipitatus DSM 14675]